MSKDKLRSIMKTFITSQFGYCPMVWMFHSRKLNSRTNKIQERALRLVYNDKSSNLQQLLDKDKSVIHERNLQVLATELYKVQYNLGTNIMHCLFCEKSFRIMDVIKLMEKEMLWSLWKSFVY